MEQSESIKELAAALAKAQAVTGVAKKNSTNPHFKSDYADLLEVWGASREALTAHGISVLHLPDMVDGRVAFTVQIQHESGEWMRATVQQMDKPQQFGSFFTYLKRYSLSGVAAVVAEGEDDDGNAATPKAGAPSATGSSPPSGGAPRSAKGAPATSSGPSDKQRSMIYSVVEKKGWDKVLIQEWMLENLKVSSTSELTGGKDGTASKLITALLDGTVEDWMRGGTPPGDEPPPIEDDIDY